MAKFQGRTWWDLNLHVNDCLPNPTLTTLSTRPPPPETQLRIRISKDREPQQGTKAAWPANQRDEGREVRQCTKPAWPANQGEEGREARQGTKSAQHANQGEEGRAEYHPST
ncbi:hypothetical protein E2C01_027803 [Portunus trituberculatus]|uniref:Uncharacterized protein n=1 Tax=Portunus trituberculatus TaxID=210409 RepID=A0A5B7EMJ0_PORTR|nr:hypothetical protein [Portunus trituberculatus]